MKRLHKYLQSRLKKFLIGFDMDSIITLQSKIHCLQQDQISELRQEVSQLNSAVNYLIENSGGAGWTILVQNAVISLDKRIDDIVEVIQAQQKFIREIEIDIEEEQKHLPNKKDLN